MDLLADVLEAGVAEQGAGEQSGLTEDLKSIADAEHEAARGGEFPDRLHDGREAGDGAGAEVVAIGEAAGDEDGVAALEVGGITPEEDDGLAGNLGDYV